MDEVPADVAERCYERCVMRAAELVWGDYPVGRREAEQLLLTGMQDGFVDSAPQSGFLRGGESSWYGADRVEAPRSLVSALYSAAGGEEWSLIVETDEEATTPFVRVRGVSLDVPSQPRGVWHRCHPPPPSPNPCLCDRPGSG